MQVSRCIDECASAQVPVYIHALWGSGMQTVASWLQRRAFKRAIVGTCWHRIHSIRMSRTLLPRAMALMSKLPVCPLMMSRKAVRTAGELSEDEHPKICLGL